MEKSIVQVSYVDLPSVYRTEHYMRWLSMAAFRVASKTGSKIDDVGFLLELEKFISDSCILNDINTTRVKIDSDYCEYYHCLYELLGSNHKKVVYLLIMEIKKNPKVYFKKN